eukprot:5954097-Karenia_brevis.AAC.1
MRGNEVLKHVDMFTARRVHHFGKGSVGVFSERAKIKGWFMLNDVHRGSENPIVYGHAIRN